ncbi:MAG: L-histidine Nalpha-methyltransferase [Acidimicrobiaceae bacterium]|jgi:L-histidine N-alpha-methyltransferase|nr:L-histidine Nalpha-methyltransferase [Acidimicrobiaceae bacterium]
MSGSVSPRLTFDVHLGAGDRRAAMEQDVRQGLTGSPKSLPPVWFYDQRGSELFDDITRLPEYYLTRAERSILVGHAAEIADLTRADTLVELGSGTSEKTRLLLDALAAAGSLRRFVPLDVDADTLRDAATAISTAYGIDVHAVVGDFHRHLQKLPAGESRLVAFLGSTIGNLAPVQRHRFLSDLRSAIGVGDHLLLGTDLVKDRERIRLAYNDASGVTAAFNRNVLTVLNAELGATFDPLSFDHLATWNEEQRWVEMRLRSQRRQQVEVGALDLTVRFEAGEDLITEISAKFTAAQVEAELSDAGFSLTERWTDAGADFLLTLATPSG